MIFVKSKVHSTTAIFLFTYKGGLTAFSCLFNLSLLLQSNIVLARVMVNTNVIFTIYGYFNLYIHVICVLRLYIKRKTFLNFVPFIMCVP